MDTIKLTVGIPTYNRCDEIKQALDSVMPQVSILDDVDVVIVDNASADRTAEVVREYQDRFSGKISYCRNTENIGFAANVDAVVKAARGEYVLILSDDDALEHEAVRYVLDVLSMHRVTALFLGWAAWNRDMSAPLQRQTSVPDVSGRAYANGSEYVVGERAFPPGLISGYVVNRSAWADAGALDFRETLVVQILTVLRMAKDSPVYASYIPYVRYRTENEVSDKTFYRNSLCLFRHRVEPIEGLARVCAGYSSEALRLLRRNAMRTIIYHLVVDERCGNVDFKELERRIIAANGRFNVHTLIVSALIRVPLFVLNLCKWGFDCSRKLG